MLINFSFRYELFLAQWFLEKMFVENCEYVWSKIELFVPFLECIANRRLDFLRDFQLKRNFSNEIKTFINMYNIFMH